MLPIRLEKAKGRDLIKKLDAEVAKTGGKNESSICGVVILVLRPGQRLLHPPRRRRASRVVEDESRTRGV